MTKLNYNDYYKDSNGFVFKVGETYYQENRASALIKIKDWINTQKAPDSIRNLGHKERIMEVPYMYMSNLAPLSWDEVKKEELKSMKSTVAGITSFDDAFNVYLNLDEPLEGVKGLKRRDFIEYYCKLIGEASD